MAYFYEYWILCRHLGHPPLLADIDKLFDSIHIPHHTRWDLKLPCLQATTDYMQAVKDKVADCLASGPQDPKRDY